MSYYGQGDYYARGGLLDVVKGIGRAAVGFVTGGPTGAISSVVRDLTSGGGGAPSGGGGKLKIPGFTVQPGAMLPGGQPFITVGGRRRRRMNPANARALSRATRRVDGFVRLAKRSLKHTNYKLVSKSAGKSRSKPSVIVETGPGGVRA